MKYEDIKDFEQRCEEHQDHQSGMITSQMLEDRLQEEIDELRAFIELQQPERHVLQAKGEHPAPCARFCEANAFNIEIRRFKAKRNPLTDEQIRAAAYGDMGTDANEFRDFVLPLARAIEAAHGIKGEA